MPPPVTRRSAFRRVAALGAAALVLPAALAACAVSVPAAAPGVDRRRRLDHAPDPRPVRRAHPPRRLRSGPRRRGGGAPPASGGRPTGWTSAARWPGPGQCGLRGVERGVPPYAHGERGRTACRYRGRWVDGDVRRRRRRARPARRAGAAGRRRSVGAGSCRRRRTLGRRAPGGVARRPPRSARRGARRVPRRRAAGPEHQPTRIGERSPRGQHTEAVQQVPVEASASAATPRSGTTCRIVRARARAAGSVVSGPPRPADLADRSSLARSSRSRPTSSAVMGVQSVSRRQEYCPRAVPYTCRPSGR